MSGQMSDDARSLETLGNNTIGPADVRHAACRLITATSYDRDAARVIAGALGLIPEQRQPVDRTAVAQYRDVEFTDDEMREAMRARSSWVRGTGPEPTPRQYAAINASSRAARRRSMK